MIFPVSSTKLSRDDPKFKRRMDELNRLRVVRQKIISKEVVEGVEGAIRTARRNGHKNQCEIVRVDHWKNNSVMRIMYYNKLGAEDREAEIRADVEHFEAEVARAQKSYPEYQMKICYPEKTSTLSHQINVWKKKK